jgi:hypothetical protein
MCQYDRLMASSNRIQGSLRALGRAAPNAGEMELLRAATLDVERASAAWTRWASSHTVDAVHHRSHDLLPSVSANVPADVLGAEAERLRGLRRRYWVDNQFRLEPLVGALELLQPLGIRPVVTKGAALSTTVYVQPGLRRMADVDLVVGPERFDEVVTTFRAAGWRRSSTVERAWAHGAGLVDTQRREIDLHRWVLFPRFSQTPETAWYERVVSHTIRGCEVSRFRCSDELVLTVLHGMLNNGQSSIRWPLDVVQLARHAPGADAVSSADFWAEVVASVSAIAAGPVVARGLDMCRTELDAPIPESIIRSMAATPLDRSLALQWALCRHGVTAQMRFSQYAKVQRWARQHPSLGNYIGLRASALRTRGVGPIVRLRVKGLRKAIADQLRT